VHFVIEAKTPNWLQLLIVRHYDTYVAIPPVFLFPIKPFICTFTTRNQVVTINAVKLEASSSFRGSWSCLLVTDRIVQRTERWDRQSSWRCRSMDVVHTASTIALRAVVPVNHSGPYYIYKHAVRRCYTRLHTSSSINITTPMKLPIKPLWFCSVLRKLRKWRHINAGDYLCNNTDIDVTIMWHVLRRDNR
jgi:hypothetical protein